MSQANLGRIWIGLVAALFLAIATPATGRDRAAESARDSKGVTLVVRETDVREVFEMLARTQNVSIVLRDTIEGDVSVSLFDVEIEEAIQAIAQAAGFGVDRRKGAYYIVEYDDIGQSNARGSTQIRAFKIQYSDADRIREILEKHLSRVGQITTLEDRRMVVIEDMPDFLDRVERILAEIDRQPRQILLEARILEVGLNRSDSLGIDWTRVSEVSGGDVKIGVQGFTSGTAPGLIFDFFNQNLEGAIEALSGQGRVRALAAPQLLTMEDQEAEVLVGSRLGYRVTTTINQVTTESVEFLDSGVILRFTPSVDREGRILLEIHPEVSLANIDPDDQLPRQTTTEVTTRLLAEDGQRIFIGGLIRNSANEGRSGIPLLSRIPFIGALFGRSDWNFESTETVVIVQPTLQPISGGALGQERLEQFDRYEPTLDDERFELEDRLRRDWPFRSDLPLPEDLEREDEINGPTPAARFAPPPHPASPTHAPMRDDQGPPQTSESAADADPGLELDGTVWRIDREGQLQKI